MNQYTAPWNEEKIATLKRLWNEGTLSCRKIGKELGVSHNSVASKVRQLGLPMRRVSSSTKIGSGRPVSAIRPPRSDFNPGPPKGRQPDHCFGVANKIKPSKPPILTPDEKEFIPGKGIPLLDLAPGECRWPINERTGFADHLFCGQKGYPYCGYHARMAYGSGMPSERRATEAG